ncbi:MAG: hypothetical protein ACQSGP_26750 [Frankia sp.]
MAATKAAHAIATTRPYLHRHATVADIALAFTRRTNDTTLTGAQRAALREAFHQQIRAAKIPPSPPPAPPALIGEIDLPIEYSSPTGFHEDPAGLGQPDGRPPLEQRHAKLALQVANLAAQRRLRHHEPLDRSLEPAFFRHGRAPSSPSTQLSDPTVHLPPQALDGRLCQVLQILTPRSAVPRLRATFHASTHP